MVYNSNLDCGSEQRSLVSNYNAKER